MRFTVNDSNLSIGCELDSEPEAINLNDEQGLGDAILDFAVDEMIGAVDRKEAPDGEPWAELQPATIAAKGHATIGYRTGDLTNPAHWRQGPREILPRSVTWTLGKVDGKALGFHNGRPGIQEPRPLVGWTAEAKRQAIQIVAFASPQDAGGPEANQADADRLSSILTAGQDQEENWQDAYGGWSGGDWA